MFRAEAPGAEALEDRTNRPLLLVGMLGSWAPFKARVGLEEDAYRIGDESGGVNNVVYIEVLKTTYHLAVLEEYCLLLMLASTAS